MNLDYFISQDAPTIKPYSLGHIILLLCCFALAACLIIFRDFVRDHKKQFTTAYIIISLIQQIFLQYGWYAFCTDIFITDGLPLHLSRVSSIFLLIFMLTKNNKIADVAFYFSIYSMTALFYPMGVYHFLHINTLSFVINHVFALCFPIYIAIAYSWLPTWKSCFTSFFAFLGYLSLVLIVNRLLGSNYFYLNDRPFFNSLPLWIYLIICIAVTFAGFSLVTYIIELCVKRFGKRNGLNDNQISVNI